MGVPQISTGTCSRKPSPRGTDLGCGAKTAWGLGKLVDDDLVARHDPRAHQSAGRRQVLHLDGFPEISAQAEALETMLRKGTPLEAVVLMHLISEFCSKRLTPQNIEGLRTGVQVSYLDARGGRRAFQGVRDAHRLIQRPDEREESSRKRLDVYRGPHQAADQVLRSRRMLRHRGRADADVDTVCKSIVPAVLDRRAGAVSG